MRAGHLQAPDKKVNRVQVQVRSGLCFWVPAPRLPVSGTFLAALPNAARRGRKGIAQVDLRLERESARNACGLCVAG